MALNLVLYGALLPGLAALAVLAVAWRAWPGARAALDANVDSPRRRLALWSSAPALAAAYLIVQGGLVGWPAFPAGDGWEWPAWIVVFVAFAGLVGVPRAVPRYWRGGLALGISALAGWLCVPNWFEPPAAANIVVGVATAVLWLALNPLARRASGASLPLALCIVCAADAFILERSANAKMAQLAASFIPALAAAALVGWWTLGFSIADGGLPVLAVARGGLLFNAYANNYGDVPLAVFVVVAAAPLALWVAELPAIRPRRAWLRGGLRLGLVVVPVAAVTWPLMWPPPTS